VTADRVIGFDLSIVATGVALPDGTCYTICPKRKGDRRLTEIRDAAHYYVWETRPTLAVLEQIAEGDRSSFNTVVVLAMVHGQVRSALADAGVPFTYIRPTTLKKWATGNGRAEKIEMIHHAVGLGAPENINDNEADAWWLKAAGDTRLGRPPSHLHQMAADLICGPKSAVKWPVLDGLRATPSRATP
jgi:crossover junction endodeoxyribonuclease RuvC